MFGRARALIALNESLKNMVTALQEKADALQEQVDAQAQIIAHDSELLEMQRARIALLGESRDSLQEQNEILLTVLRVESVMIRTADAPTSFDRADG